MNECLDLLNGSDYPEQDRLAFFKAQVIFWLLGAADGHAKNFSLFLSPGGQYRMTPLYDVISVQPDFAAGRMGRRDFKMAMAVGRNRHYPMHEILPRHFRQTAKGAALPDSDVENVFAELVRDYDAAVEQARRAMPDGFPGDLADSIATGAHRKLRVIASAGS
jgi:serine/threonine-protein kinase HipA